MAIVVSKYLDSITNLEQNQTQYHNVTDEAKLAQKQKES